MLAQEAFDEDHALTMVLSNLAAAKPPSHVMMKRWRCGYTAIVVNATSMPCCAYRSVMGWKQALRFRMYSTKARSCMLRCCGSKSMKNGASSAGWRPDGAARRWQVSPGLLKTSSR
jgi:hypothetical protein